MDHSEQTLNQLQQIDGGATQIPAAPVLATSSLRAPVSLPILLPQISSSHNRLSGQPAQHVNNLQQKLRLFWQTQKQQVEQTTNFKKYSVPLARIRNIMKADEDVHMIATETPILFAKAVEMFILDMTLRAWTHTEEHRKRVLQISDIAAAISESDMFDFLVDVIPKDLLKPSNATIPQVGSSAITYPHVPPRYHPVGPSGTIIYAGDQQPQPHAALSHLPPPLEPFINWRQQFMQQNQKQGQPQQNNQQQDQESAVPLAPQPQEMLQHNNQQQNQEPAVPLAPQPQEMLQYNNQEQDDNEEF